MIYKNCHLDGIFGSPLLLLHTNVWNIRRCPALSSCLSSMLYVILADKQQQQQQKPANILQKACNLSNGCLPHAAIIISSKITNLTEYNNNRLIANLGKTSPVPERMELAKWHFTYTSTWQYFCHTHTHIRGGEAFSRSLRRDVAGRDYGGYRGFQHDLRYWQLGRFVWCQIEKVSIGDVLNKWEWKFIKLI